MDIIIFLKNIIYDCDEIFGIYAARDVAAPVKRAGEVEDSRQ